MDRFWKEALGLGVLLLVVAALIGQGDEGYAAPVVATIGAVLIAAGLLTWWVKAQIHYRRQSREEASSRR